MKTVLSFFVLLLFVGLLSGCVREEAELGSGTGRVLTVNYSFDGPLTRAATDTECKVKDVALFFYNADDAHPDNETYVGYYAASVPEGNGVAGSFALSLPDAVIPGNRYKLIIIGNYNAYPPEGKSPAAYAEQYKARTYSVMAQDIQGQLPSGGTRVTTPLPFSGRLLGQDGNETTLTAPSSTAASQNVSVKFSRAVARFDVTNLAADRLTIAWAKVCNYRTRGYFFHEAANAGAMARGTSATAPSQPLPPGYVPAPEPTGTPGTLRQDLNTGGLYAFPNFASYTAQGDSVTTCLLVAGYYQDPAAGTPNTTRLTYYRVNMGKNTTQFLRRNSIYTLIINSVKKAGAATEEDAMNQKERLLDYEVNNDWESGESGTVTDGAGHSLTLSPTSVALSSEKGDSALITVDAKGGTSWTLAWKNNADNAFGFKKVNDTSFRIFTNGKNETASTRNATLTVTLQGLATPLQLTVSATQLPTDTDRQILAVDGKQGAFDYPVLGQGAQIALQVLTGSPTSRWKAEADTDLNGFVSSFTPTGANKEVINLSFPANTGAPRQGTLTVKRLLPNGNEDTSVAPVLVTFKQEEKSSYVVSLQPDYSESGLTINAFQPEKGTRNGISKNVGFTVQLSDPDHYTFVATCSFNQHSDAFITKGRANTRLTAGPLQTSKSAPSSVSGANGDSIWLNVFRTGPGDADITGDLTVKAVPKNPAAGGVEVTYSIPITLKTSCKIGDSKIGTVLWADRNVGATPRDVAPVGLNYTVDAKSDDHANTGFAGIVSDFDHAAQGCTTFGISNKYEGDLATGWRLPTNDEHRIIAPRKMYFSKQRAYIVSDDTTAGMVGCWFPLPNPSFGDVQGYYWSSTSDEYAFALALLVEVNTAYDAGSQYKTNLMSLRCVRDLPN